MLSSKDKDDFIGALCKQVTPKSHFNINKPDKDLMIFLFGLKERGFLDYFAEHHSVVYMELNPSLYSFMEQGGFTKEEEIKNIAFSISEQTDEVFKFFKKNYLNKCRIDWEIEKFLPSIGMDYHGFDYDQMENYFCSEEIIDKTGNGIIFTRKGKEAIEKFDYYSDYLKFLKNEFNVSGSASKKDIEEINGRIDVVIEWLKKGDMGNEILFDELQELKDAGEKINLKNWKQLVKGKLFDLATEKALGIGIEGLRELMKTLTGEDPSKLLK